MAVTFFEAPLTTRPAAARHALAVGAASRTAVLVASAAGFAIAFVVAYLLFVRTEAGQRAENGVVRSAHSIAKSTVDWATPLRSTDLVVILGGTAIALVVAALVRRRFTVGVSALLLLAAPLALAQLLKLYVLERPEMRDGLGVAGHNSFPSGHVSAAMAVLFAIAVVLPRKARLPVLLAGAFGAAWVSASTIALGWHRLSDTLGGCTLVAAAVCAGAALISSRRPDGTRIPVVPVLIGLVTPVALVLGGFAVLSSATSEAARFVAAMVLAAVSAIVVVVLVAAPLHKVGFDRRIGGSARDRALIASAARR
ncbi:phosphatase PAP2 family protein [Amycolatopsis sp. NPDC059021]|uniref:phosphatase PAP2 family protein n=1 Tax=Amycolatopsis sp. NPDC059021 TaxID=3346704 RepID=UPI00366A872E